MLGNFSYCNPTKLYFGENSLSNLSDELKKYGDNVVLVYGSHDEKIKGYFLYASALNFSISSSVNTVIVSHTGSTSLFCFAR